MTGEVDLGAIEGLLQGDSLNADEPDHPEDIEDNEDELEPPPSLDDEDHEDKEAEEDQEEPEKKPQTFKVTDETTLGEMADHLGVKMADIYNTLIPIDGDTKIPLGEIKDHYKEKIDYEEQKLDLEEKVSSDRNEIMVTRRLISGIMQALGDKTPANVLQAVQQSNQQLQQRESDLLLKAVPEWQDAKTYSTDRQEMVDFVSRWGFTATDLSNVIDHRLVKMIRDVTKFNGRVAKARETFNQRKNKPGKPSSKQKPADKLTKLTKKAKNSRNMTDKVAAVEALIS